MIWVLAVTFVAGFCAGALLASLYWALEMQNLWYIAGRLLRSNRRLRSESKRRRVVQR